MGRDSHVLFDGLRGTVASCYRMQAKKALQLAKEKQACSVWAVCSLRIPMPYHELCCIGFGVACVPLPDSLAFVREAERRKCLENVVKCRPCKKSSNETCVYPDCISLESLTIL
eukprot:745333-Amphidinium_carterae.1